MAMNLENSKVSTASNVVHKPSLLHQLVECFSFKKNFKNLMNLSHEKSSITCLNGLRVISIYFVIFYHSIQFRFQFPFREGKQLEEWNQSTFMNLVGPLTIFVDPFFIMSGTLVARSVLKGLEKWGIFKYTNIFNWFYEIEIFSGKFSIWKLYIERYFRITFPVAVTICFPSAVFELFYHTVPFTTHIGKITLDLYVKIFDKIKLLFILQVWVQFAKIIGGKHCCTFKFTQIQSIW